MESLLDFGVTAITRPPRCAYNEKALPENIEITSECSYKRFPIKFPNNQGNIIIGSYYCINEYSGDDHPCIIYLHGNAGCQLEGTFLVNFMLPLGISVCLFDFNGCGHSEGDFITLGYNERDDVCCVMTYLTVHYNVDSFVLWGRSMGASCALFCLDTGFPVRGVIVDSPFSSLPRLVKELLPTMGVGKCYSGIVLSMLASRIKEKLSFDIYDCVPIDEVRESNVPIFFIHANSDDFISYEHSIDLYQACGSKDKTIKIVPGEHNTSRPNDVKANALVFAAKHLGRVLDIKSVSSDVESGILHFAGLTDLRMHIDEGADEWEATE